jgi:alpha-beta hydrolase superfamily lysophospholipase
LDLLTWHQERFRQAKMTSQLIHFNSLNEKMSGMLFIPESAAPLPALVVCHGAGEFKENYFELCEALAARGVATLAMDMHGHGASGGEKYHVNMRQWVPDVSAAIDHLSTRPEIARDRIGAFGLSSGGTAILEAAIVDARLKALIALDATVRNSLPFALTAFLKSLVWIGAVKKKFTGRDWRVPLAKLSKANLASDPAIQKQLLSDPRGLAAFMAFPFPSGADAFFVDTIQRVSQIKAPTLILWGADDKLDPPETAHLLYAALTCEKEVHVIPGNGHVGHLDRNRDQVFALTADWAVKQLAK